MNQKDCQKSNNYLFSKERNDQFDVIKSKFYKHKLLTGIFQKKVTDLSSLENGGWDHGKKENLMLE